MFASVHWRCHLRVGDRHKAERLVGRVEALLGHPMEITGYERYWKLPGLAEVQLVSPLNRSDPADALLATLESAWAIGTGWSVGPGSGDRREFEGIAAITSSGRFTVPGIEWMTFSIGDDSTGTGLGRTSVPGRAS
ncbi:hypothetical protein [Streptomyces fructofermentans]|uniref:Uncharacterized protein n=1 Tax=Streptomyces fructofermentans TaxID=152141 RepID=A0A918N7Z8_9ACTN|nr:hypothetical protein [Streptomyces fructofermentans]GGX46130.1 hypothetical protein GCM10010515_11160 [Streptomyces fructofermentans]